MGDPSASSFPPISLKRSLSSLCAIAACWCSRIAGIPPTLIAGIYGMNFKGMPEYDWAYGYPYGLAMIVLSAIIPLAWFKWRGWF